MLSDTERKVLRILCNFSSNKKRMPMIGELCIKTGRSRREIILVLINLEKDRYIKWTSPHTETIVILEGWERDELPCPGEKGDYRHPSFENER